MITPDWRPILAPGRADLERLRANESHWNEVAFRAGGDGHDENAVRRAGVLWAAQYDRADTDLELLRHLLDQEITCAHEVGGLDDSLRLAIFLVARFGSDVDLPRFYEARHANYDTYCGLSELPVGRERPEWDPGALREWVARFDGAWFPSDPALETDWEWVERARMLGMAPEARAFIHAVLARDPEPDESVLNNAQYELADIGDFAEAADVQGRRVDLADRPWDRGSRRLRLSELERQAGRFAAALRSLRDALGVLEEDADQWRDHGLGRSVAEEHFALVLASAPTAPDIAREAFTSGDTVMRALRSRSVHLCRMAVEAAEAMGDAGILADYRRLLAEEQAQIVMESLADDEDS